MIITCVMRSKLEIEKLAGMYTSKSVNQQLTLNKWYNEKLANIERGMTRTGWISRWMPWPWLINIHYVWMAVMTISGMELNWGIVIPGSNEEESGRRRLALGMELQYIYKNLTFRNNLTYSNVKAINSPLWLV